MLDDGLFVVTSLINHRGDGHHSPTALIAMIDLWCHGRTVQLPTRT